LSQMGLCTADYITQTLIADQMIGLNSVIRAL